jgi:hypothetical protein
MTETETFDELDRALGTVLFDGETLVARAVVQGRRQQRRRRIAAGAGVAALGALAVVPGALVVRGDHGIGPSGRATDGARVGPEQMDARFAAALPGPSRQGFMPPGREGNTVQLERTLDPDGLGRGEVNLSVVQTARALRPGDISSVNDKCDKLHSDPGGDGCQRVPGGWVFSSFVPARPSGTKDVEWTAQLVSKNGSSVSLVASNWTHLGVPPSRTAPVLSPDQLVRLVTDPIWLEPAS